MMGDSQVTFLLLLNTFINRSTLLSIINVKLFSLDFI